ncbi:ATP-binding response regulator [Campylobacter sp. 7477a]|uniref:ATP-binding response regulator n=1 Tax=Campylobacter sp. 7477a TaxID=2735741 RepID=UPI00301488DF|nr:response regulator [Campylobacter sp. 7477a]
MKFFKDYTLLISIVVAIMFSAYTSYEYMQKATISNELISNIKKQTLLKQMTQTLIQERRSALNFINNPTPKNEEDFNNLHAKSKKITDEISKLFEDMPEYKADLIQNIKFLRENIQDAKQKYSTAFLYFFQRINSSMIESYLTAQNSDINLDLKIYITILNKIYSNLGLINESRSYISEALSNHQIVTQENIMRWLNDEILEQSQINLLPQNEVKAQIEKLINSKQTIDMLSEFSDLYLNIVSSKAHEISSDDIKKIDQFEYYKFSILLEFSDLVENKLIRDASIFYSQAHSKFIAFLALTGFLVYSVIVLFARLRLLNELNEDLSYIKEYMIKKDITPEAVLKELVATHRNLSDKYNRNKMFNGIKNIYLNKLIKTHKNKHKQNAQSIAFLKRSFLSADKTKAINTLDENTTLTYANFENIKNILDIESSDFVLNNEEFDPQILFKNILESKMGDVRDKKINFITFIDPKLDKYLVGDDNKIKIITSNIISSAISQCNQYANITVEIKTLPQELGSEFVNLSVSVQNDANTLTQSQIHTLLNSDANLQNYQEDTEFWIAVANMYLELMNSKIFINAANATGGIGNEFRYTIKLRTTDKPDIPKYNKNLQVCFVNDINAKYNSFFTQILKDFGIDFQTVSNLSRINDPKKYNMILMREDKEIQTNIKNLSMVKDPLTPIGILSKLKHDYFVHYAQDFSLNRPQVLIYDNNSIVLNMCATAFETYGVDIVLKNNYEAMLEMTKNIYFDIIFITAQLHGDITATMKEYDRFKALTLNAQTPVIGMLSNTSSASEKDIESLFDAHIKKPFNTENLKMLLYKFIPNFKNFVKKENDLAKNKEILLCKKSPIENKIFVSTLEEFNDKLTVASSFDEVVQHLRDKIYGLVLVDEEIEGFNIETLSNFMETAIEEHKIDAKLFVFSNKKIQKQKSKSYIKEFSPHIGKIQLANAIRQELGHGPRGAVGTHL